MNIDLNQLKILIALDDERNITRAAKKLFISQSAASHALAKLRERFNDPLFLRTSGGMIPTQFTSNMLPVLRQGMSTIERSVRTEKKFNPSSDSHTFYIGACDYFEFIAMPELATRFKTHAPNIRISIDINSEHVKMERVESGRLDLYVGVDDIQKVPQNFNKYPWIKDKYVAVVPKWRELPNKLSVIEFAAQSQVHLPITSSGSDVIDNWLQDQKLYRNIQMIAQSYAVGGLISAKSGLLFCTPYNVAKQLVEMLPLKIVELPDDVPHLSLSILAHKLYDYHDSAKWMISEILKIKGV
ncbi:LysR family transcriptional regulator [Vibrio sp. CK2-1]|uniref:LysR family transcriptional regulator n=1 Tax=Vibrio sp. CK2-1 TaxID=2912249 RepID=UPI001F264D4B|nr:LysR family transcriptional regulator [Vibrio sp. CK2-1]